MPQRQWRSSAYSRKSQEVCTGTFCTILNHQSLHCADLYGPQDTASVASAAQAVLTGADLIMEELPESLSGDMVLRHAAQGLGWAHGSLEQELVAVMQQRSAELDVEE